MIAIIRGSDSAEAARRALLEEPFGVSSRQGELALGDDPEEAPSYLSERQAQAVLDMQLRRLAQLESRRINEEHEQLVGIIAELEALLADPALIDDYITEDVRELADEYGDERRTQVFPQAVEDIADEDLIAHQQIVVTISERGYMKRVPLDTYRSQGRGGRGVTGMTTRESDAVRHLWVCDTHDSLLLFTASGRVYSLKGYEVPEGSRTARGIPVVNLVEIEPADRVTAAVVVTDFSRDSLVLATAAGDVKRTPLEQFASVRRAGLIAMRLGSGDELIGARAASDRDDALLVGSHGQAIRFTVGTLRVASRASGGVRGMRLPRGASVIALVVASDGDDLLVVSERGGGKRTPIGEYTTQGRGGSGVVTFRVSDRSGPLRVARVVRDEQELMLVSREGIVLRTRADLVSQQGRLTQGVSVMAVGEGDAVASLAVIDFTRRAGGEGTP